MLRYTLILGAVLVFMALCLFIITKRRKHSELREIDRRANNLANSERARHMWKTD